MGTIVTGGLLLVVVGLIIRGMVMNKKKGGSLHCGSCCKDCDGHCR